MANLSLRKIIQIYASWQLFEGDYFLIQRQQWDHHSWSFSSDLFPSQTDYGGDCHQWEFFVSARLIPQMKQIFWKGSASCPYLMSKRQGYQLFHLTWCYGNVPAVQTSVGQPPSLGGLLESDCPIHLCPFRSVEPLSCSNTAESGGECIREESAVEGKVIFKRSYLKSSPLSRENQGLIWHTSLYFSA